MPTIQFADQTIQCQHGDNLRQVLMDANAPLYNGISRIIHCRGFGTCGTCSVRISGDVSEMTSIEKWRLSFPPHDLESGLRLACQTQVLGDARILKGSGLWGNRAPHKPQDSDD